MHAILSYRGNGPTNRQDRLQYTAPQLSTQCKHDLFDRGDNDVDVTGWVTGRVSVRNPTVAILNGSPLGDPICNRTISTF